MLPLISVVDFTRSSQYDQRVGACLTFVCFWNFNACTVYWKKVLTRLRLFNDVTNVCSDNTLLVYFPRHVMVNPASACNLHANIYFAEHAYARLFSSFLFSLFSCTTVTRDSKAIIDQPRRHSSAQNPADPFSRLRWSHSKASSPAN